MKCSDARPLLPLFIDTALTGKQMQAIAAHMEDCAECRLEVRGLTTSQQLLSSLARPQAPRELALKLRTAVNQEIARRRRPRFEGVCTRLRDMCEAFMVPATAAFVTTVLLFGLLLQVLVPVPLKGANDVPTKLYTPPVLTSSPFALTMGHGVSNSGNSKSIVVEADIDAKGRVQDYRILSAPEDVREMLLELKNLLIFTVFTPATSFGQPTNGRVILSFSKINVKG